MKITCSSKIPEYRKDQNQYPQYQRAVFTQPCDTFSKSKKVQTFEGSFWENLLFRKKDNDELNSEEAQDELKKIGFKKQEAINNSIVFMTKQGAYSKQLIENAAELKKQTKFSGDKLASLIKICRIDGKFNKKIYNDIINLSQNKFDYELIHSLIEYIAIDPDKKTYRPEVAADAIQYKKELGKNLYRVLRSSKGNRTPFQQEIFDKYINLLRENKISIEEIEKVRTTCYNKIDGISSDGIDKVLELKKLGLTFKQAASIINLCNYYDQKPKKRLLESVTKELPDIKDSISLYSFLEYRTKVTRESYSSNYNEFNNKAFNFFNELQKLGNYTEPDDMIYLESVTAKYTTLITEGQKDFYNLAIQLVPILSASQSYDVLTDCFERDYYDKRIPSLFNGLNDDDKDSLIKILSNLKYDDEEQKMLDAFLNLFSAYNNQYGIEHFERIFKTCYNNGRNEPNDRYKYALNNINEKYLDLYLHVISDDSEEKSFSTQKDELDQIETAKKLLAAGFTESQLKKAILSRYGIFERNIWFKEREERFRFTTELKNKGVHPDLALKLSSYHNLSPSQINNLIKLRSAAFEKRDELEYADEELTDEDIEALFFTDIEKTIRTIETVGLNTLIYSFKEKYDNVEDYMENFNQDCFEFQDKYQKLLEIVNPENSEKFKYYSAFIKAKKEQLTNEQNPETKKSIIKEINDATHNKNELLKNAIKDPKDKLETATVFFVLLNTLEDFDDDRNSAKFGKKFDRVLTLMNPKTEKEKKLYYEKLNELLFNPKPSKQTLQKLNLTKSKYFLKLFNADDDFNDTFAALVDLLEQHPNQSPLNIFNSLEQNIETKRLFKKSGLNYDNWVKFNPNSHIEVNIKTDFERQKQNTIRNLETDFNDTAFKKIPKAEKDKLFKALENNNIKLIKNNEAVYEDDGVFAGTKEVLRLYKDNSPVKFEDMRQIIKILKKEINENEFWNKTNNNTEIDNAKETIKNHILKLRYNEIKATLENQNNQNINIRIQKADMNDISHSLFLGNDASCCTKIGTGCNMWTAPNYIKNKLISCIEVKDGDNFVGNTMMFVAKINGKPALVLDNIELKVKYQFNDKIRDAIFEYAKIITKELGKPNMPIYAGPNRHKVNMNEFPLIETDFEIIGATGDDEIYLDFETAACRINQEGNEFTSELYKIR